MFSKFFKHFDAFVAQHSYLAAVTYMLVATTAFSAMSVGVRVLAPELSATEIVTLRNFLTLMLLLPWLQGKKGDHLRTDRLGTLIINGFIAAAGMIAWTYCLTIMPLAHATALSFTAPLFSTLFAVLFLKERIRTRQILALIAGFCGTLIIIRPGAGGFNLGAMLVLLTACAWSVSRLLMKSLGRTESPLRTVFYMNLFMFLVALPFSSRHLAMPSHHTWMALIVIACCSLLMHFAMARAYTLAPVVALMPFEFTRLISTALFAYIMFDEHSDMHTWVGAVIIVASAAIMTRRNTRPPTPAVASA